MLTTPLNGVENMPDPDREDLKTGYTTGTCATATTKAGLINLLWDRSPDAVEVDLPAGETAELPVSRVKGSSRSVTCVTKKDAGDDPDVTDGALIRTTVTLNHGTGLMLEGGPGVGTVTRPGLPVNKGEPAINPVPRRMIRGVVESFRKKTNLSDGVTLTVDVENGRQLAKRTLNPRLGIVDGLSILGTTGIVEPYSHASYIASIEQGIDVAVKNGLDEIVLSTGGRTEKHAQQRTGLPEYGYVQFAGYLREALLYLADSAITTVRFFFMPGKFSKFAQGNLSLHSKDSSLDVDRLIGTLDTIDRLKESTRNKIASLSSVNQIFEHLSGNRRRRLVTDWIKRIPSILREEFGAIPWEELSITVLNLDGETLGERRFSP